MKSVLSKAKCLIFFLFDNGNKRLCYIYVIPTTAGRRNLTKAFYFFKTFYGGFVFFLAGFFVVDSAFG